MTDLYLQLWEKARRLTTGSVLVFSAILTTGCISAPEINHAVDRLKPAIAEENRAQRQLLVGNWYGEAITTEGQTRRWLRQNKIDGEYELTVRDYNLDGSYLQQVEVGRWGVSGQIYFTIMKGWRKGKEFTAADLSDPYSYDAYEVVSVSPDRWVYQHKETQSRFYVERVEDNFSLPGQPSGKATRSTAVKAMSKSPTLAQTD